MDIFRFAKEEAERHGIDPSLVLRVISAESGGNVRAVSNKGARGPMQLMPATARDLGVNIDDPMDNIRGGVRYLAQQLKAFGKPELALAAYNAGPGNVKKYGGVPPFQETRNYVNKITGDSGMASKDDSDIFGSVGTAKRVVNDDSDIFASSPSQVSSRSMPTAQTKKPTASDSLPSSGLVGMLPNELKAGIVAAGREGDKIVQGVKSGFYRLTGQDKKLADLRETEKENDKAYKNLEGELPWSTAIGSALPYFGVPAGAAARGAASLVGKVAPAVAPKLANSMMLDAALTGGALGQVRQGDETSASAGAIGGAIGGAVGRGLQKVISPNVGNGLSEQKQKIIDSMREQGVKLTPGQRLNSPGLQKLEASLESNPLTSFVMQDVKDANRLATNRAANKAIGEAGDAVDATKLANAEERIGNVYRMVETKNPVKMNVDTQRMSNILDELGSITVNPNALDSDPLFSKAMDYVTKGEATQQELSKLSSQLGKKAKAMMTSQQGDRSHGIALMQAKDLMDDALYGSLSGETKKAFGDARSQYRTLMQLYKPGVLNEQAGDVSGKSLANVLSREDRKGFRLGNNTSDLYNAARFSKAFPAIVGDSGTATRLAVPLATGALGAASGMYGGDPMDAAKLGLAGFAAPIGLSKLYMSPAFQGYLGNKVLTGGAGEDLLRRLALTMSTKATTNNSAE